MEQILTERLPLRELPALYPMIPDGTHTAPEAAIAMEVTVAGLRD